MKWEQRDSNPRHSACKADAATAELCSRVLCLGIEPSFHVCCPPVLTNRLPEGKVMSAHHQQKTLSAIFTALEGSEDMIESDISNRRLVEDNLLEYKCSSCGITDMWNNKKLSLQLDHINGINNDNRLNNLRFLCPNCHSQTETYCGKHRKKVYNCLDCGKEIKKDSKRCNKCSSILNNKNKRKFEVSKEELIELINQYPMTKIGKMFNVSDNAIRKRCKTLGIDLKSV